MTIQPHDEARIRRAVRQAVVTSLESELDGDDYPMLKSVMKEVWEECGSVGEVAVANDELRAIIAFVKDRS